MDPAQPDSRQPTESPPVQEALSVPAGSGTGVRWVLVRAIALFLLIVLVVTVLVWLVSIPVFSVWQGDRDAGHVPQMTPASPADSALAGIPAQTPPRFIEPVPRDLEIFVTIQPKDSAGHVSVQFDGGRGRAFVKGIDVRLTKPDGTVATGSMNMQDAFPEVTLQGSKGIDRVEVFALFLSGKTYRVAEDQVPYRSQI